MFNSDLQLVRRCLEGEPEAFGRLYDRHAQRVFNLVVRLTENVAEAEDLTQETFIAAYSALPGWRGQGAFSTWLCGIACKRVAARHRAHYHEVETLSADLETAAPDGDPFIHCTRREREHRLQKAIGSLPRLCRDVFVLVKVQGFTYRETAEVLEVPVGTIKSRLWRAVRLLQCALAPEYPSSAEVQQFKTVVPPVPASHSCDPETNDTETEDEGALYVVRNRA